MRWWVFAVVGAMLLVAETSLRNILVLRSLGNIAPSFPVILVVFLALFAPRGTALWAAWTMGLVMDLLTPLPHAGGVAAPIVGPHALGYAFGAYLLLQLRAMLFRRRALTLAAMTVVCFMAASVVIVAIYVVHTWYPRQELYWSDTGAAGDLLRRLGIALYTALLALPIGKALVWTTPIWAFRAGRERRPVRR